jgi:hypothetical protein
MRDDCVLRLQQIGAGRVELFCPEVSAAARIDELSVDPRPIAARLNRARELLSWSADRLRLRIGLAVFATHARGAAS